MPLTLTQAISDTVGITDSLVVRRALKKAIADTVGITDSFSRHLVFVRARSDTVGVTDVLATRRSLRIGFSESVDITDSLRKTPRVQVSDTVGITDSLVITGALVQFDTWRPVPKPDNSLVLLCRTPVGEHDSPTGLTHLTLWTILSDGTDEHPVLLSPADNGYGWDSYSHPEWSPSGDEVMVAAETSTEYKLVVLDATGFGS